MVKQNFKSAEGNKVKSPLLPMLCRATQDEHIMVKSSDKMWPTGEGKWQTTSILLPGEHHEWYEKEKR